MSQPLLLKTCLVTGASWVRASYASWSEGKPVMVRDPQSVSLLRGYGSVCESVFSYYSRPADLDSARSLVQRTNDSGIERIDVLVNNAAVLDHWQGWETSSKDWEVTRRGSDRACHYLYSGCAAMSGSRAARSSIFRRRRQQPAPLSATLRPSPLVRFSETLAEEVREPGISVTSVAPGPWYRHVCYRKAGAKTAGYEYAAAQRAQNGRGRDECSGRAGCFPRLASQ